MSKMLELACVGRKQAVSEENLEEEEEGTALPPAVDAPVIVRRRPGPGMGTRVCCGTTARRAAGGEEDGTSASEEAEAAVPGR
jgi:hypothetical protein